jgi:hypothetical protein
MHLAASVPIRFARGSTGSAADSDSSKVWVQRLAADMRSQDCNIELKYISLWLFLAAIAVTHRQNLPSPDS